MFTLYKCIIQITDLFILDFGKRFWANELLDNMWDPRIPTVWVRKEAYTLNRTKEALTQIGITWFSSCRDQGCQVHSPLSWHQELDIKLFPPLHWFCLFRPCWGNKPDYVGVIPTRTHLWQSLFSLGWSQVT